MITCVYRLLILTSPFSGAIDHANDPPPPPLLPVPAPPRPDPSLLIGKVCAAIHAGPGAFKDALAHWRAKYPITAFPDPGKNIEVYEGIIGRERMRGPANFSRSFAEFMAGWAHANISYDKGDRLLEPSTNPKFNPEHFPSMSLLNLEKLLVPQESRRPWIWQGELWNLV